MDPRSIAITFLTAALRALGAAPAAPGGAAADSLPEDILTGFAALTALFSGLAHGNADLSTVEDAINSMQKLAVALGLEPPMVAAAISALEWALPVLRDLYSSGLISGGIPAAFPPGGGPGTYRGR
jgi:hypothetical protein